MDCPVVGVDDDVVAMVLFLVELDDHLPTFDGQQVGRMFETQNKLSTRRYRFGHPARKP
jgi:hypothetical protein